MAFTLMFWCLTLSAGWAVLFHYLGEEHARTFAPALFLFKPFAYGLVCVFPALLLGLCTSFLPGLLCARLLLGPDRFREYLFWEEGRAAPGGGYYERISKLLTAVAL
jgi:hypothetical protein